MATSLWNLENGIRAESDGNLIAKIFSGSLSVGSGDEEISIDSDTSTFSVGSDAFVNISGTVIMDALETSDPLVSDKLWNNSGVLNISSGS